MCCFWQVEYISNGEIPSDLSQALVFTNQSLVTLQNRIIMQQHEKVEQRKLYKQAREQHKQLIRDRREMMIKIESESLHVVFLSSFSPGLLLSQMVNDRHCLQINPFHFFQHMKELAQRSYKCHAEHQLQEALIFHANMLDL